MRRLRKLLAAWLAPPDPEPAEPATDPEPPPEEYELVRRTPATPRRELAVAMLLVAAAVLFAAFVAAYALGSLAHGGFSELVSDIDLALIISDPPRPGDASMIQVVADAEKSRGFALHERLSVFWGTPVTLRGERKGGRFPALDRLDLIENGRLLVGADDARAGLPRRRRVPSGGMSPAPGSACRPRSWKGRARR